MIRKMFMIAGLLMAFASLSVLAQSRQTQADPLSGTWTGELTPAGAPAGRAVSFQLKFDGKGTVTGTFSGLQSRGDVKKGTFDPKTGALSLHLGKQGDAAVLLILDGTVTKGVATGRVSGDVPGEFSLTKKS